jgi:hypothetical protein
MKTNAVQHPMPAIQRHPPVPEMLCQLERAYQQLLLHTASVQAADTQRLLQVLEDLCWYGERLGEARWEISPRAGRWSFAANLWHITEQVIAIGPGMTPQPIRYYIDHGKEHVGQAAELLAIFSSDDGTLL